MRHTSNKSQHGELGLTVCKCRQCGRMNAAIARQWALKVIEASGCNPFTRKISKLEIQRGSPAAAKRKKSDVDLTNWKGLDQPERVELPISNSIIVKRRRTSLKDGSKGVPMLALAWEEAPVALDEVSIVYKQPSLADELALPRIPRTSLSPQNSFQDADTVWGGLSMLPFPVTLFLDSNLQLTFSEMWKLVILSKSLLCRWYKDLGEYMQRVLLPEVDQLARSCNSNVLERCSRLEDARRFFLSIHFAFTIGLGMDGDESFGNALDQLQWNLSLLR